MTEKPKQPKPAAKFKLPDLAPKRMNFYSKAGTPKPKKEGKK